MNQQKINLPKFNDSVADWICDVVTVIEVIFSPGDR